MKCVCKCPWSHQVTTLSKAERWRWWVGPLSLRPLQGWKHTSFLSHLVVSRVNQLKDGSSLTLTCCGCTHLHGPVRPIKWKAQRFRAELLLLQTQAMVKRGPTCFLFASVLLYFNSFDVILIVMDLICTKHNVWYCVSSVIKGEMVQSLW